MSDTKDVSVLVLVGSLRAASINRQLAELAIETAPAGVSLQLFDRLGELPFYNEDIDNDSVDESVVALRAAAAHADAALVITPEYNGSVPGVLKNAIDWLSRPSADIPRVFGGRKIGVIGASPGGFGTLLSQTAWLPVLKTLGTNPWFGARLQVARAGDVFDKDGRLVDERVRGQLRKYLAGFADFCASK
jgi:chromate reductase